MAIKNTLSLTPVVNIQANLGTISAPRKAFNTACLMGDIPSGVTDFDNNRVVIYSDISEMLTAGFTEEDRIYKAAWLVFEQAKTPPAVAIGKAVPGESPLSTVQACRIENGEWYIGVYCKDITDAQIMEVAEYVESVEPKTMLAYTTKDPAVYNTADGGIFSKLKNKGFRRTFGQYSTAHDDAVVAIVGWAMGAMTAVAGSAYTLAYKQEVGVDTENTMQTFTTNQVNAIKSFNGNVYINRGTYYNIFEEGKMADGSWFDEIIFLDKFINDCQLAVMDLLVASNKIPQTESGMTRIKNAIQTECDNLRRIGFISEGVWKGASILNLNNGDTLPGGYVVQSEPIDAQIQADRDARKAPPIYISLKLAGAIHHVTIQIDVNR